MPVVLAGVPDQLRVPLAYIEFDSTRAMSGAGSLAYKVLVIGQRMTGGQVAAGVLQRILSADHAEQAFGMGSKLAAMFKGFKGANRMMETWAIAVDDDGAGVKATGLISLAVGSELSPGTLNLYLGGQRLRVGVAATNTAAELATKLINAINANPRLPVVASAVSGQTHQVRLTANHKGLFGNDLDVRLNYFAEDTTPNGLTVTITGMASGAGNPDITAALAALGDEWWNAIVMPYTDSANLGVLQTELESRWGPLSMKDSRAWMAFKGTHGETADFGADLNCQHFTVMGTGDSPTPTYVWAAVNAAVANASLAIDPARPLQTLELPGVLPPATGDRWDFASRNLLLYDGISTFKVQPGNRVTIERQITTYQTNALGAEDESYLDVETLATLSFLRYSWRQRIELRFPRHKLRADPPAGMVLPLGQPMVTPGIIREETLSLFQDWEQVGLVEDFNQFAEELIVEIDESNKNRVNMLIGPNLVNQFRIFAGQIQFIL